MVWGCYRSSSIVTSERKVNSAYERMDDERMGWINTSRKRFRFSRSEFAVLGFCRGSWSRHKRCLYLSLKTKNWMLVLGSLGARIALRISVNWSSMIQAPSFGNIFKSDDKIHGDANIYLGVLFIIDSISQFPSYFSIQTKERASKRFNSSLSLGLRASI